MERSDKVARIPRAIITNHTVILVVKALLARKEVLNTAVAVMSPEVIVMVVAEPTTLAQAQPVIVALPAEIGLASANSISGELAAGPAPGAGIIADMSAATFCDLVGMRIYQNLEEALSGLR